MRKVIIALLGLIFCVSVYAIPADSTPRTIKLKDGRVLTISLRGDEHLSWAKSLDGYTLLQSEKGEWVYACMDTDGNMVASDIAAADPAYRTSKENKALAKFRRI